MSVCFRFNNHFLTPPLCTSTIRLVCPYNNSLSARFLTVLELNPDPLQHPRIPKCELDQYWRQANCHSKANITCAALVCVSSFVAYHHLIDKSHLRRQYWMSNQRSFLFTKQLPAVHTRRALIQRWRRCTETVPLKQRLPDNLSFYPVWKIWTHL